jgi:hypothetical protein
MNIEDFKGASEIDIYLAYTMMVKGDKEWEAYLYEQGEVNEEEPMNEVKALRLAAGLTQQELSVATGIEIEHIAAEERGEGGLSAGYWRCIYGVCNDRIKIFARDAGLTIKLG